MDSRNYQQAPDLSGYKQLNKDDSKNLVNYLKPALGLLL